MRTQIGKKILGFRNMQQKLEKPNMTLLIVQTVCLLAGHEIKDTSSYRGAFTYDVRFLGR